MSSSKTIVLRSSDDVTFEIDEAVALESQTLKQMIADNPRVTKFWICDVTSKVLAKVIEYCKKHVETPNEKDLKLFDAGFVKVDQTTLFDLIQAAHHLKIESLLDLTCQTVTGMIRDKTPEEVSIMFNTKNDFRPEEKIENACVG